MNKISIVIIGLIILFFITGCEPNKQAKTFPEEPLFTDIDSTEQVPQPEVIEDKSVQETHTEPQKQEKGPVEITTQSDTDQPIQEKKDDTEPETTIDKKQEKKQKELESEPKTISKSSDSKDSDSNIKTPIKKPVEKPKKTALYKDCEHIFATYVDKNGNVDYKTLRRKRGDLIRTARTFENVHPAEYLAWSKSEKIAFWTNAYNIFTLKVVIDNYPIQPHPLKIIYPKNSIIHISGAWTKKYFDVMGIQYTLREIEREIILQKFKDPRTCLAFSYATMGGAYLRNEPYSAEKLEQQLDDQVKKFINSQRGMRIDRENKIIKLSDIFNWYKNDFITKYGDMKKFRDRPERIRAYFNCIEKYIPAEDLQALESVEYTVEFLKYDWQLNEQTGR